MFAEIFIPVTGIDRERAGVFNFIALEEERIIYSIKIHKCPFTCPDYAFILHVICMHLIQTIETYGACMFLSVRWIKCQTLYSALAVEVL